MCAASPAAGDCSVRVFIAGVSLDLFSYLFNGWINCTWINTPLEYMSTLFLRIDCFIYPLIFHAMNVVLIKKRMKELGMDKWQLATALGASHRTVEGWLSGKAPSKIAWNLIKALKK